MHWKLNHQYSCVLIDQTQLEIEKALAEDPNVYEYDSIYDDMQETKKQTSQSEKNKERGKVVFFLWRLYCNL